MIPDTFPVCSLGMGPIFVKCGFGTATECGRWWRRRRRIGTTGFRNGDNRTCSQHRCHINPHLLIQKNSSAILQGWMQVPVGGGGGEGEIPPC